MKSIFTLLRESDFSRTRLELPIGLVIYPTANKALHDAKRKPLPNSEATIVCEIKPLTILSTEIKTKDLTS